MTSTTSTSTATADLVAAVKAHATEHYNEGGWDILIETMDDEQIAQVIAGARTVKGAITKAAKEVGPANEMRAEVIRAGGEDTLPEAKAKPARKAPAKAAKAPAAPKATATRKGAEGLPTVTLPEGKYAVRWPHGAYDLLQKLEGKSETSPKWLVRCNAHGTTTPAEAAKDGDQKGRKAARPEWCPACKTEAKAEGKAPAKSTAPKAEAKASTKAPAAAKKSTARKASK